MTGFNSKRDAAADKLQEDLLNYGTAWSQDGKRIDPMSVYKEQPAQEPVARVTGVFGGRFTYEPLNRAAILPVGMALYAAPPQPAQEHNFCSRCGKRTNDIHICTPPQGDA